MRKLIVLLLFSNFLIAQSVEGSLSAEEFDNAKKLFLAMINSGDYQKKEEIMEELFPIVKEANGMEELLNDPELTQEKVRNWIKLNVAKENVDRATALFSEQIKLEEKIHKDNKVVYDLLQKANKEQRLAIMQPYFKRTRERFGM